MDLNLKLTWIITSEDSFKKEGILSRAHMKASVFKKPRTEPIKDNLKDDKSRCWRKAGSGGGRGVQISLNVWGLAHTEERERQPVKLKLTGQGHGGGPGWRYCWGQRRNNLVSLLGIENNKGEYLLQVVSFLVLPEEQVSSPLILGGTWTENVKHWLIIYLARSTLLALILQLMKLRHREEK